MLKFMMLMLLCFTPVLVQAEDLDEMTKDRLKSIVDTDSDGKISKAEYMAVQERRFGEQDADGDGFITDEEMRQSWDKWKSRREALAQKQPEKQNVIQEEMHAEKAEAAVE